MNQEQKYENCEISVLIDDGCSTNSVQVPPGECPGKRVLARALRPQRPHQLRHGGGREQGGDTQDKRPGRDEKTDWWEIE